MKLRDYQQAAVDSCYNYLRNNKGNCCIVIPTAGGKTPVIATICKDCITRWNGRVIILSHVKELLEQSINKLADIAPDLKPSVFSAGLGRKETDSNVIIAQIQSVYKHAAEIGKINIVLVDEAHLIKPDEEGRYRTFLADLLAINDKMRIVGLTATPYRQASGLIYGDNRLFQDICYEIGVKDLVTRGYISKVITKIPKSEISLEKVHIRAGEFAKEEVKELFDGSNVVKGFINDIVEKAKDRKSILVFCTSQDQAKNTVKALQEATGEEVGIIIDDTPDYLRIEYEDRFRLKFNSLIEQKPLRWLVNVGVLTTGFDAPNCDCVCLLRPTASPGLYAQMVGRGFRLSPETGKTNCLILDYGGNIRRHGPIDAIQIKKRNNEKSKALVKVCPECECVIPIGNSICPECGYEFPRKERNEADLDNEAESLGILSGESIEQTYDVINIDYDVHIKRNGNFNDPKTIKVTYTVKYGEGTKEFYEWLCPEHGIWLRKKFEEWWKDRTTEKPVKADEQTPPDMVAEKAVFFIKNMGLAEPKQIVVKRTAGKKFPEIVDYIGIGNRTEPVVFYQQYTDEWGEEKLYCYKCNDCKYCRYLHEYDNECYCNQAYRERNVDGENACVHFEQYIPESDVPF